MTDIYLDIETIPSQEDWVAEYITNSTKPPGNISKQESIDKWYAEKQDQAIEDNLRKCSFDGAMNHIVCIAVAIDDYEPVAFSATTATEERNVLETFYYYIENNTDTFGNRYIGHNITGFDLRVMLQRSIVLGVQPCGGVPFHAKPWDMNPFDTMTKWDPRNSIKLNVIAKALGLEGKKSVDGSMVYDMWKGGQDKDIAEYAKDDVRLVREIHKRMKGFF